jgi:hypothetical protein
MTSTATADRRSEIDAFEALVAEAPYRFDLWHLLRWLDAHRPGTVACLRARPDPRVQ